jgi:hypothetical protein
MAAQESANPRASPCGGRKLDRPAPARDLYVGTMFRHTWTNATRCAQLDVQAGAAPAARVLILSYAGPDMSG